MGSTAKGANVARCGPFTDLKIGRSKLEVLVMIISKNWNFPIKWKSTAVVFRKARKPGLCGALRASGESENLGIIKDDIGDDHIQKSELSNQMVLIADQFSEPHFYTIIFKNHESPNVYRPPFIRLLLEALRMCTGG